MLFPGHLIDGIRDGSVTVAFRSWKRPTVKAGGTLLSPAGLLAIDAVDPIEPTDLTVDEAVAAGAASVAEVLPSSDDVDRRLYRIRFHRIGDDPRLELARTPLSDEDRDAVLGRLERLDAAADEPWTERTLHQIADNPGVVSTWLARSQGIGRDVLKRRVRRLKDLGLTESLEVGYRLSERGESLLAGGDPS